MQVPLQITMRDMPASEALETRIRAAAQKLEQFHARITSCRVTVAEYDRHRQQGRQFGVRVEVRAPAGEEVISTLKHHEDVYVAVRDAFDSARRQLEDAARKARGDVKAHARPGHGRVARIDLDQGIGFIETEDGRDLYFSRVNVVQPAFESLAEGTEVQFIEEPAGEGTQAKRVTAGKHHFE